jgi:hypothetical protein
MPRPHIPDLPQKIPSRIAIYAKDVQNITGRKPRTARRILSQIRLRYNKLPSDYVTVKEFCAFTGIKKKKCNLICVNQSRGTSLLYKRRKWLEAIKTGALPFIY